MNRIVPFVFFVFIVATQSFSQKSLSDYSYVIISEQFEFQKEKDKYELNSLAKFLFNKHGFHAYFNSEVPRNATRCEGLWVDAEGTPGFIYTKVQLVIKDCNGFEVYRTKYGNSKIKDYKKAYYESLREAFAEIEKLGVQQKEIGENNLQTKDSETVVSKVETETPEEKIKEKVIVANKTEEIINPKNLPSSKYTNYSYAGNSYLLRKTSTGYNLYQESENLDEDLQLMGKMIISSSKIEFKDINNLVLSAHFDVLQNLIIEKEENILVFKIED